MVKTGVRVKSYINAQHGTIWSQLPKSVAEDPVNMWLCFRHTDTYEERKPHHRSKAIADRSSIMRPVGLENRPLEMALDAPPY